LQALASRTLHALASTARERSEDLLSFLLPQRCPVCGEPADPARFFCERCERALPRLGMPVCARCLGEGAPADACLRHPGDRVHAAFVYDEAVAALVRALKFGSRPDLGRGFAPALAESLPARWRRPALVTAVPLHGTRRRERGYDQAAVIAEALADALGAPFSGASSARARRARSRASARASAGGTCAVRSACATPDGSPAGGCWSWTTCSPRAPRWPRPWRRCARRVPARRAPRSRGPNDGARLRGGSLHL
jgi:predicted amidophosphoribosyltransferase